MACSSLIALILTAAACLGAWASVCYKGQELVQKSTDHGGASSYTWVLNAKGPYPCTDIRLGGVNTHLQSNEGLVLGHDGETGTHEHTWSEESATVVMDICETLTINLGAHETTPFLPVTLNEGSMWELVFTVRPAATGASQITREIIHMFRSDADAAPQYKIIILPDAVEVQTSGGAQAKLLQVSLGTGRHIVALGSGKLIIDESAHPTNPFVDLTDVKFVQFESNSGAGAIWSVEGVPCSWESHLTSDIPTDY